MQFEKRVVITVMERAKFSSSNVCTHGLTIQVDKICPYKSFYHNPRIGDIKLPWLQFIFQTHCKDCFRVPGASLTVGI